MAISEYLINEDSNPEIINKRTSQQIEYIQELAIRYLRPPTPPAPGEIIITQEANIATKPAPPLIIRQQPVRAETPEPLVKFFILNIILLKMIFMIKINFFFY